MKRTEPEVWCDEGWEKTAGVDGEVEHDDKGPQLSLLFRYLNKNDIEFH